MSVSFEINDVREAPAVACVAMPVMVERPKSARQARRSLFIRMFAFVRERQVCRRFVWRNTYAFQIPVYHAKAMHVRQAVRNVNQLNSTSALGGWGSRDNIQARCGSHVCSSRRTRRCFHLPSTRKPSQICIHSPSLQAMVGHLDAGGASMRLPLGRSPVIHSSAQTWRPR
jgi:hypothetical protein